MRTFFDSSAFVKRYINEPGSPAVEDLCMAASELALSIVCIPEIMSALNRRIREESLTRLQYREIKKRLSEEVADVEIVDLTPPVISSCIAILEKSPVHAMDALHVACAVQWKPDLFVSSDMRQLAAAKLARLRVRSV